MVPTITMARDGTDTAEQPWVGCQ